MNIIAETGDFDIVLSGDLPTGTVQQGRGNTVFQIAIHLHRGFKFDLCLSAGIRFQRFGQNNLPGIIALPVAAGEIIFVKPGITAKLYPMVIIILLAHLHHQFRVCHRAAKIIFSLDRGLDGIAQAVILPGRSNADLVFRQLIFFQTEERRPFQRLSVLFEFDLIFAQPHFRCQSQGIKGAAKVIECHSSAFDDFIIWAVDGIVQFKSGGSTQDPVLAGTDDRFPLHLFLWTIDRSICKDIDAEILIRIRLSLRIQKEESLQIAAFRGNKDIAVIFFGQRGKASNAVSICVQCLFFGKNLLGAVPGMYQMQFRVRDRFPAESVAQVEKIFSFRRTFCDKGDIRDQDKFARGVCAGFCFQQISACGENIFRGNILPAGEVWPVAGLWRKTLCINRFFLLDGNSFQISGAVKYLILQRMYIPVQINGIE